LPQSCYHLCVRFSRSLRSIIVLCLAAASVLPAVAQNWRRVKSPHFDVYSDAGEKQARETALRFEQLRSVAANLLGREKLYANRPVEILLLKDASELRDLVPPAAGKADAGAVCLSNAWVSYIVLSAPSPSALAEAAPCYAAVVLDSNFPPAPAWFDKGIARYLGSATFAREQVTLAPGTVATEGWLPMQEFLAADAAGIGKSSAVSAQALATFAYFWKSGKQDQVTRYLALSAQRMPPEQAVQQAFGTTAQKLEAEIRSAAASPGGLAVSSAAPEFNAETFNAAKQDDYAMQALVAGARLLSKGREEQARGQLRALVAQRPGIALAHQALGMDALQSGEAGAAVQQLSAATEIVDTALSDYLYALALKKKADAGQRTSEVLGEMRAQLAKAIDLKPDFADAYNLLAFNLNEAHDFKGAADAERQAMALAPREERYVLDLSTYLLNGKSFEEAAAVLQRVLNSADPQLAKAAAQQNARIREWKEHPVMQLSTMKQSDYEDPRWSPKPGQENKDEQELEAAQHGNKQEEPAAPDTRPLKFLKGSVTRVECKTDGSATVKLSVGRVPYAFNVKDIHEIAVMGTDQFSCEWKNVKAAVNYRATGAHSGDLASIEIQ
jgi:hypothetical protein